MTESVPLLEVVGLEKTFPLTRSISDMFSGRPARGIHAVDKISLTVAPGETLGLIGESGSGKTTLGWVIARLHEPSGGSILFEGRDVTALAGSELRLWRRHVQIVFQDPVGSLDPRLRVWQIVGEPMKAQHHAAREQRRRTSRAGRTGSSPPGRLPRLARRDVRQRVRDLLPMVGLPPDCLDQYPHEFSGGGRQRISLARALSVRPKLVVLDEPTSALDVAVQSQILNRLVELQREQGISYLLITHNVAAVRYVADRVAVMYLGQIVEIGPVRSVLERPVHPYTKALIAAVPVPDARRRRVRYRVSGDVPTLINPPPGCRFATRCPFVIERCRAEDPALLPRPDDAGHRVACHRADEVEAIPPESLLVAAAPPTPPTGGSPSGPGA